MIQRTIQIKNIINGYVSSTNYDGKPLEVYHKDIESAFKHCQDIYTNKTNLTFTGELKLTADGKAV